VAIGCGPRHRTDGQRASGTGPILHQNGPARGAERLTENARQRIGRGSDGARDYEPKRRQGTVLCQGRCQPDRGARERRACSQSERPWVHDAQWITGPHAA
jgi:hypothetical protein